MGTRRFLMISSWRVLLITLLALPAFAGSATLTGTLIAPNGRSFNGRLRVQLAYPAKQVSTGKYVTIEPITYRLVAGVIVYGAAFGAPAPTLVTNDDMDPSSDFYWFDLMDSYGGVLQRTKFYVTGTTFDIGLAVPTPITTLNISFQDLLGFRNISGDNFTVAKSFSPDGSGFKHKRVASCTTGNVAGNSCNTTINWTTSFVNATSNYTAVCTLEGVSANAHVSHFGNRTNNSIVVTIVTDTNTAVSGTLDCIAVHD